MEVSLLLDFYGELLRDKVLRAMEMYYNDDLSLSEIADDMGITRQGVRDLIKRAESNLYSYEEKLGLYKRFVFTQQGLESVKNGLADIQSLMDSNMQISKINNRLGELINLVDELIDEG